MSKIRKHLYKDKEIKAGKPKTKKPYNREKYRDGNRLVTGNRVREQYKD